MPEQPFAGDRKVGESLFSGPEKRLVKAMLPRIPGWLETYHLTLCTVLWSAGILGFSWLARTNLHWLWLVSAMILLQYLTDLFDGAVGRHRNTGLVKWGYFMDHFLDYVFLCSIVIGYSFLAAPELNLYFFVLLAVTGGYMVNSFLAFAALNRFEIYFFGLGPTELRLVIILMNAGVVFVGTGPFPITVPIITAASFVGLLVLVYRTHRSLWAVDMERKRAEYDNPPNPS